MFGLCFMSLYIIKSNCYSLLYSSLTSTLNDFLPFASLLKNTVWEVIFLYCCNIVDNNFYFVRYKPHSLLKITLYFTHFAFYCMECSLFNHWNSQNWQMPVLSVVTHLRSIKSSNRSLLCNKIIKSPFMCSTFYCQNKVVWTQV